MQDEQEASTREQLWSEAGFEGQAEPGGRGEELGQDEESEPGGAGCSEGALRGDAESERAEDSEFEGRAQ
jgi:hypothetical protein